MFDNKEVQAFQEKAFYVSPLNGLDIQKKGRIHRIYPYSTERIYNVHNGIVYFQNEVGGFIHPLVNGIVNALSSAGYRKENISVPCSHKETPANADVWAIMLMQAEREQREAFLNKCLKTSEEKNIAALPANFLWNACFEIPMSGIDAVHWNKPVRVYPFAHIMLDYVHGLVGQYNIVNGYVSFVDWLGRMFVTVKTDTTLKLLTEAGYSKDDSLPVPFSNGEIPTAMLSRCKWETVCNVNKT